MTYSNVTNLQTGETVQVPLTAEEIAEREAHTRDVLPGDIRMSIRWRRAAAYAAEADPLFFITRKHDLLKRY